MRPLFLIETCSNEHPGTESSIREIRVFYFFNPFSVFLSLFLSFFYLSSFSVPTIYCPPSLSLSLPPIFPFFVTTFLLTFPSISLVYRAFPYSITIQYSLPLYECVGRKSTSLTSVLKSLCHQCPYKSPSLTNVFIIHHHLPKSL
jgi:hypothetical protein